MRRQRISEIMGNIDETYIAEATSYPYKEKITLRTRWVKWGVIAACMVLVIGVAYLLTIKLSTQKYRLVFRDGNYFIQLDQLNLSQNAGGQSLPEPYILFSSYDEMISDIKKGDFSEEEWIQLEQMALFAEESGEQFQICNLDDLWVPEGPIENGTLEIEWRGLYYRSKLVSENKDMSAVFSVLPKDVVNSLINEQYYDNMNDLFAKKEKDPDRDATVYYYSEVSSICKMIFYKPIQENGREIHIIEMYGRYKENPPENPIGYVIFITGEYSVKINLNFNDENIQRPSLEWLLSFDMKKYEG